MFTVVLILFFLLLIGTQIYVYFNSKYAIIEGLEPGETVGVAVQPTSTEYQPYGNNPTILAEKNAGNIEYLKGQISSVLNIKHQVETNTEDISKLTEQLHEIGKQQTEAATKLVGNKPAAISGTSEPMA
jgi:hypothetical protein